MVPNIFHFCYFGGRPLGLIEYLAVKSCSVTQNPEKIYFYYDSELSGEWWEKIKPMVTVEKIAPIDDWKGRSVPHPAHKADIWRLEKLWERGGIYLDLDIICRRSFEPLRNNRVVLGLELVNGNLVGLGNAVIMAQPAEQFIDRWREGFDPAKSLWRGFRSSGPQDKYYTELSVKYAHFLATYWPEEVHVEPVSSFYEPTYNEEQMKEFFEMPDTGRFDNSYCHHLWGSVKEKYKDFITIEEINKSTTGFANLVKRYL